MHKRSSIALTLCAILCGSVLSAAPHLEILSKLTWEPDIEGFGGLSGLEVDEDGAGFAAVSDNGVLYQGQFNRDDTAGLQSIDLIKAWELVIENGTRPERKRRRDMEGLVVGPDGMAHVSLESASRILSYQTDLSKTPRKRALPRLDAKTPKNMGFEALALAPNGQFVTIGEGSLTIQTPFNIYRQTEGRDWEVIYQMPRSGGFRPVGADFGPDGNLYVLTRSFNGLGFAANIDRILFENEEPVGQERLFTGKFRQFDNLEGLSVWKDANGDLRLVAISDDNFSGLQSTMIVEFALQE